MKPTVEADGCDLIGAQVWVEPAFDGDLVDTVGVLEHHAQARAKRCDVSLSHAGAKAQFVAGEAPRRHLVNGVCTIAEIEDVAVVVDRSGDGVVAPAADEGQAAVVRRSGV